jgi:hypothetical protein
MGGRRYGQTQNQSELPPRVLGLPNLDHCKVAVLNSLGSPASRRVYEYAIDQAEHGSEQYHAMNTTTMRLNGIWKITDRTP